MMQRSVSIRELAPPCALLVIMAAAAVGVGQHTGVAGSRVFVPYLGAWASLTLLAVLSWFFAKVAALAPQRADRPLQLVVREFSRRRMSGLCISAVIFPLFLGFYTWAKTSIPLAVGYSWEETWADADRWLFGADAWRIPHSLIPPAMASAWSFFYAVVWGIALAATGAVVAAFACSSFAARFFTALMLSWLIGCFLLAFLIPAAGPVFAHLANPAFEPRFEPLRNTLVELLGTEDIVLKSQRYLAVGYGANVAVKGGGISAMPSMHIATATIFICAACRTPWLWLAVPFWALTFVGSIYLGYHYVVDTPVAVAVAIPCWLLARQMYSGISIKTLRHSPSGGRPVISEQTQGGH